MPASYAYCRSSSVMPLTSRESILRGQSSVWGLSSSSSAEGLSYPELRCLKFSREESCAVDSYGYKILFPSLFFSYFALPLLFELGFFLSYSSIETDPSLLLSEMLSFSEEITGLSLLDELINDSLLVGVLCWLLSVFSRFVSYWMSWVVKSVVSATC